MIKKIKKAQKDWAKHLVEIGKTAVCSPNKVEEQTRKMLDKLYDFRTKKPEIIFKPTLASEHPFRMDKAQTISYFITGMYSEDKGFALQPWKSVKFGDFHFIQEGNNLFVMGAYTFIDYKENKTLVDYTFGYRMKENSDDLKIFLHHSSLRYSQQHQLINN